MALKTGTIWHLSDLHLRAGWEGGDPSEVARVQGLDRDAFTIDAQNAFFAFIRAEKAKLPSQGGERLANALVVSGDLVHQSGWTEASRIHAFLERLRKALELEPERVLVVPGNHDVNLATARVDPAASRKEFRAATVGYRTISSHCESVCFEDDGLAFLLTDTVSHVGVSVNLDKVVDAVMSQFSHLDRAALADAVRDGVATEVPAIAPKAVRDAIREIASLGTPAPSVSGAHPTPQDEPRLPANLLGFLVSHYPLLPCPYVNVEVKQFHLPVGAGPVKGILADAGVYVCLHGHQHVAWVHAEKTAGESRGIRFVCVGAGSLTQDDRAFNIIRYALMTETGEARIAVQPIYINASEIREGRARPFHIPPRVGSAARAVRLVERIHADGLVRGDKWFSDVSTLGWHREAGTGRRLFSIPVVIQTDQGGPPVKVHVKELTRGFEAHYFAEGAKGTPEASRGRIDIVAAPETERLSLAYREFNRFAYCSSVMEKARCFGGARAVPGLRFDEEALVHVVRVPCERLEIYIRTPELAPEADALRCVTYIENPDGDLVPMPRLQLMSEYTIETWPEAKRLRLTIPRPMQGAAYGLAWELPRSGRLDVAGADAARVGTILKGLESLRTQLMRARVDPAARKQLVNSAWRPFLAAVRMQLQKFCPDARDTAEVALFVPSQPLLSLSEYQRQYEKGVERPEVQLQPTLATFDPTDLRYRSHITVGLGVAGLAYATNRIIRYDSSKYPPAGDEDGTSPPAPYLELVVDGTRLRPHSKLYTYPLAHPELPSMPLGCVCIGSIEDDPEVELEASDFGDELLQLVLALGSAIGAPKWIP